MGMTWKFKVQRVAFALLVVGALAMASGANWFNDLSDYFSWLGW
jgi:1,4-dihydroxy-2-naphthoate octaprenyltransferase